MTLLNWAVVTFCDCYKYPPHLENNYTNQKSSEKIIVQEKKLFDLKQLPLHKRKII